MTSRHYCCKAKFCGLSASSAELPAGVHFFRFPRNAERCQIWVEFSGNVDLVGIDSSVLYNTARMCSNHFPRNAFTNDSRNRLNRNALPSLFGIAACLQPDTLPDFPADIAPAEPAELHSTEISLLPTDCPDFVAEVEIESTDVASPTAAVQCSRFTDITSSAPLTCRGSLPSTSRAAAESVSSPTHTSFVVDDVPASSPSRRKSLEPNSVSSSKQVRFDVDDASAPQSPTATTDQDIPLSPVSRPSSTASGKTPRKQRKRPSTILQRLGETRLRHLSPRKRVLHSMLSTANKRLAVLKKRCSLLKEGLCDLQSHANSNLIDQLESDISPAAAKLFSAQLKHGKKSPRGRRYTTDDKILALSIYKRSPKTYRLLQTFLALPSPRTLIIMLNKVPFRPGINAAIFSHLQQQVEEMDDADRVCSLMFDEVALSSGVDYSEKLDLIVGYEDFGNLGRTSEFANHALVFMIRGLRKKWKQPVAYYFCRDVTKTDTLASLILESIDSLQATGLHVVCTICNQAATNWAALDALCKSHKSDVTLPVHGKIFKVNGEDIAILYDPPHLLKSLRNAFMKYNVIWTPNAPTAAVQCSRFTDITSSELSTCGGSHTKPARFDTFISCTD